MQKIFILIITGFAAFGLNAQTITPGVLNSSGVHGTIGTVSFEFNLGEAFTSTISNGTIITQGLLQPTLLSTGAPLPVLGLYFVAKRNNQQQVQLNWKTNQEINNDGFIIERRRDNESEFISLRFVASLATGGNSSTTLNYTALDTNVYVGNTYYRLQQKDLDGKSTYSMIQIVSGNVSKNVTLKAWPIPAKEFFVQINGVANETILIIDALGRLVRSYPIQGSQPIFISNLNPGIYFLRLQNNTDVVQKVVVQ